MGPMIRLHGIKIKKILKIKLTWPIFHSKLLIPNDLKQWKYKMNRSKKNKNLNL
jgi:hypothetical protein